AADAEARRLLRREYKKFNRVPGPESVTLQRANCFESAKHSNDAIVFPGIRNRINVRTRAHGGCRGISADPSRENVSNGILPHGEPGFLAARDHPGARF